MNSNDLTSEWIDKLESMQWLKPIIMEQVRAQVAKEDVDQSTREKLLKHLVEEKKLLTPLMARTAKNWIL